MMRIGIGSSHKKIQRYRPIKDNVLLIFVFGSNMETHEPRVYPTTLGGVSQGFWSPFIDLGALSAIFRHLKTGNFAKSAHFQVPKNGTLSAKI